MLGKRHPASRLCFGTQYHYCFLENFFFLVPESPRSEARTPIAQPNTVCGSVGRGVQLKGRARGPGSRQVQVRARERGPHRAGPAVRHVRGGQENVY